MEQPHDVGLRSHVVTPLAPAAHAPGSHVPGPHVPGSHVTAGRTPTVHRAAVHLPSAPPLRPIAAGSVWGKHRVLLLNATYEPLTAISIRRAVVLVLRERADVVHSDDMQPHLHSAGLSMPVPSVIRLRTYVRVPYRAKIPMTRAALMHRDRFRCGYCGGKANTIDHVVPRSRGGAHNWENCVACCATCNHKKADRLLSELGWTLRTALTPPKGRHWRLLATVKEIDPAWSRYIDVGAA